MMNNKQVRIDIEFARIIEKEIPKRRIQNGIDDEFRNPREITSKMIKHPLFLKLKEDLEVFKFKDE